MAFRFRWADRDLGQKLSIVMLMIMASLFVLFNIFAGLDLILTGSGMSQVQGGMMAFFGLSAVVRAAVWWRSGNAR